MLGLQEFATEADQAVPSGEHQVRVEFAYDGGGLAKGGDVTLFLDRAPIGRGRVEVTQPLIFSTDETTDIGEDSGMPVTPDYKGADRFNGTIELVQIDVGNDDCDHLIDPEALVRVAMARQSCSGIHVGHEDGAG